MTSSETNMSEQIHGVGERLRLAREQAGLSLADVSAKLKMPAHIVDALEKEQWSKLGAPVYVRGQLRSYARLLGLPADSVVREATASTVTPSDLVPRTYTPPMQRIAEQTRMRLVYAVLTAAIVVPTWLATQSHLENREPQNTVALDVEPSAPKAKPQPAATQAPAQPAQQAVATTEPAPPLVASMTPVPQRQDVAGELVVDFGGESWVKLTGSDGKVIEQALIPSGQQRSYAAGQLGKAVLGNAAAVRVTFRGQPVDLTPYVRANVVRFTVSSEGLLQPAGR